MARIGYSIGAAALAGLLGLWSCNPAAEGAYTSKAGGFRIVFPPGWEIKERTMGLDAAAFSPLEGPRDRFRDNVTVASSELSAPLTSEQVLDANLPTMISVLTDFQPEDRGVETIGGTKAAWLVYTHRQGQYRLRVKLYALAGKDRAWLIHCTAETEAFSRFEETFHEIAASFEALR